MFVVFDGHGDAGQFIADHGSKFVRSNHFLEGLVRLANLPNDEKLVAYTDFITAEMLNLDRSLKNTIQFHNLKKSGSTVAILILDEHGSVVVAGIGDSLVIGIKPNTYETEHLFKPHNADDVS